MQPPQHHQQTTTTTLRPPPPAPRVHEESVTQAGWTVSARKAPIIGSPLLEQYADQLGGVLTLPEILFGNSSLQLRHNATGITLSFAAFPALQQWKADDLPPLKVAVASEWQAARQQEIQQQQAVVLDYDWTYTTSYAGDVSITPAQQPAQQPDKPATSTTPQHANGDSTHSRADNHQHHQPQPQQSQLSKGAADGGEGSGGNGSATGNQPAAASPTQVAADDHKHAQQQQHQDQQQQQQEQQSTPAAAVAAAISAVPQWQPSERQIDRHMLMSKSEPILFYAEVPLYESELDDNGVCQLTVKVRVMPRCWLVLLRFWLRVDGSLVRLREVRHFCRLDGSSSTATPPVVIRETKWSEGTMQELAAAGAPSSVSGYEDADAATSVFGAIAPQCLKKFELHELVLGVGAAS